MKRNIRSLAKFGAIAAVLIEWLSVVGFYLANPSSFNGEQPLSYFATLPQTRIIFSLCYTLAALSFWVFVRYHLRKHYIVPMQTFTLSMLSFAAMAIVPFTFNNPVTATIHNFLAFSFTALFILGIFLMARHNPDKQLRTVSIASAILSTICLALFLAVQKDSQYVLVFEAGSGFICELWMIWISFHSFKKLKRYVSSSNSARIS